MIDELGGPRTYNHYPVGWAHAMDTPFQWTKQVASHFGGTRNGHGHLVARRDQRQGRTAHRSSAMSSISCRRSTRPQGSRLRRSGRREADSRSRASVLSIRSTTPNAPTRRPAPQYFEMLGNRAIYKDGWMASTHAVAPAVGDDGPNPIRTTSSGSSTTSTRISVRPTTSPPNTPRS